jgi:hypothetical protein
MKNQNKRDGSRLKGLSLFMEKLWLVIAIGSLVVVIYLFVVDGINRTNLQYLVFPALAAVMYGFRTTFRKRMEKRDGDQ